MAGIENLTRLIEEMTFSTFEADKSDGFLFEGTCGWRQRLIIGAPP